LPFGLHPAPQFAGFRYAGDGHEVGGQAHIHLFARVHLVDAGERPRHLLVEPLVHLAERPVEVVRVLDLLEVRDGDAAGVGQEVGMTKTPLSTRMSSASGVVGPLAISQQIRALIFAAFSAVMTFFKGGREEDGGRQLQERPAVDGFRPGEAAEASGSSLMVHDRTRIEALRVVDSALGIGGGHELQAEKLVAEQGGILADVAEPLIVIVLPARSMPSSLAASRVT